MTRKTYIDKDTDWIDADISKEGKIIDISNSSPVSKPDNPNRTIHRIGDGFGFVVWFE